MYVVTGGAGFIGSNIVAAIEERGLGPVAVCDRLGAGEKWRNIAKRDLFDVVPPDGLFQFLDSHGPGVRAVIHMGAVSATTQVDADLAVKTNFGVSLGLWRWCAAEKVPLIYASSAATYGAGDGGFDDDGSVAGLARLRPLNVYGPNEYHKAGQESVVAQVFARARAGGPARLFKSHNPKYEDGGQLRDFIWVGDCVDVILWLIEHRKVSGLFNCGSGRARSFKDLAAAVFRAQGKEPRIEYTPTPESIREKYQYFTEARMQRLRKTGYTKPFISVEEGVGTYVTRFLAAADAYR